MAEEFLTPPQELFCRYYAQNSELFGNATLSYAEAYEYHLDELSKEQPVLATNEKGEPTELGDSEYTLQYNVCSMAGSRLIRQDKIQLRIRALLNELMKDDVVDAQLVKIIMEGEDKDKVAAIKEYNKLKQRIIEKQDITSGGKPIILPSELIAKNDTPLNPENSSSGQTQI